MAASVCGAVLLVVSAGCTSTPSGSVGTSEPIVPSPAAAASSAAPLKDGSVDVTEANRRVELIMGASGRYEDMIHAMLVMVDGKLVVEQYGKYGKPDAATNTFSVTKSVTSALIGIAIGEGLIDGVEQTVGELLPRYVPVMAPGVAAITLAQLLTMTSGIVSDDTDIALVGAQPDAVVDILSTPLEQSPGAGWAYSSRGSHLLAAILVAATGRSVLDYASEKLFRPLGISTDPFWPVDNQGIQFGFSELTLTAREMATFGQLYLDGGTRNGQQVVPAEWVAASTSTKATPSDGGGYGYQWWVHSSDGRDAFAALGYAGQVILVIPDLSAVLVVSCANGPGQFESTDILDMLEKQVVPALAA